MAAMFMGRISTPRFGGVSLVLSSLLLAGGNILVILLLRSAGIAHGTDAYARVITQAKGWWHVAHVLLLLAPAIWMIGFLTLHGSLSSKNERVFSFIWIIVLGIVLYREQRSPGGNARHSGGAPLARRGSR